MNPKEDLEGVAGEEKVSEHLTEPGISGPDR